MANLIDHLETYLGQIQEGWKSERGFQVARFGSGPFAGTVTFSTIGLSQTGLLTTAGKHIHHELHMVVPEGIKSDNVPWILIQVGAEALDARRPILRGEVFGPRGSLLGTRMEALYAAVPSYFPDEFHVCDNGEIEIVNVWMIPITRKEANFVGSHGWSAFEDLLVAEDPVLTDFARPDLVGIH